MMLETFRQAVQNVWSNKLRSFLTMLGIIIGVMAVIVIVGLGNGMTGMFTDLYNTMGSDLLAINLYTSGTRTVSVDEMHRLIEAKPKYFRSLSPIYGASTQMKVGSKEYRFTSVSGVNEDYLTIEKYDLASGRGLQYADILDTKSICVIGDYVNRVIFGGNGLGQTLKVGPNPYRVVGVLQPKTKNLAQQQEGGQDDMVFVPYSTLMRQEHQNVVNMYYAILAEGAETTPAKVYLQTELEKRVSRDDYIYVESLSESIQMMSGMINIMVGILTAIAGISLLVGGIGIMNIMLVSVTERTREIGIRKALGAKERIILTQFVVEAATTSALGGSLGIALGYLVSLGINQILPLFTASLGVEMSVSPSFDAAAVAFMISVGIGVLFGYLPAKRAARLNPIEALRYD